MARICNNSMWFYQRILQKYITYIEIKYSYQRNNWNNEKSSTENLEETFCLGSQSRSQRSWNSILETRNVGQEGCWQGQAGKDLKVILMFRYRILILEKRMKDWQFQLEWRLFPFKQNDQHFFFKFKIDR